MEALQLLFLAVLPALVIASALTDLTTMKIPNKISGLLILGFFPAAFLVGLAPMAILVHVGVALAVLAIGMGMFALRWLGGGDVKLMAAACLWFGLSDSAMFALWTAVIGGLFCLVLLLARASLQLYTIGGPRWIARLMEPKGDIPYGVAIAAAALVAWPSSPLMVAYLAG